MNKNRNTSQDPDYVGPTGYEKRVIHQTHFSAPGLRKRMYDFSKDPDYYQVRPGIWRKKQEKQHARFTSL